MISDLARQVAVELGGEWVYQEPPEPRHWEAIQRRLDGATITLRMDKNRLRISGQALEPIYGTGNSWYDSSDRQVIGCAATKSPAQIAKDIERRLLPKYLPLYQEAVRGRAQYVERQSLKSSLLAQLAEASPGVILRHDKVHLRYDSPGQPHGVLEVSMGICNDTPTVRMNLSGLPVEMAMEVLRVLGGTGA